MPEYIIMFHSNHENLFFITEQFIAYSLGKIL